MGGERILDQVVREGFVEQVQRPEDEREIIR